MPKRMTGPRVGDDCWSASRAYNPPKHPHGIIRRIGSGGEVLVIYKGGDIETYYKDDFNDRKDGTSAWVLDEHGDWTKDNYMKDGYKIRLPDASVLKPK